MEPSLLSQSVWLSLPPETREKLAVLFEMPEKGSVNVAWGPGGARVVADGYTHEHFKLVTIEKMEELLGMKSDNFYELFKEVVNNVDDLLVGKELPDEEEKAPEADERVFAMNPETPPVKRKGRPKKTI